MENSISRQNVNVNVRAIVNDPNVTVQYKTKILQKNVVSGVNTLIPAMIAEANIKYIIKYDYTLSDNITIPENCVLEFDGGSVSGEHTITGNKTGIEAGLVKVFGTDVTLAGTWNVAEAYPEWFGVYPNNAATDVTPIIYKILGFCKHIYFSVGRWYLSECLIVGDGITIKGARKIYTYRTSFEAYNKNSQRFVMKLGGRADFDNPENHSQLYNDICCKNFIIEGITFDTYQTTLVNADTTNEKQNYAAICFDWCANGYVDIACSGDTPGVFIANTWEVYFKSIVLYGSYIEPTESALYFGKAYTTFDIAHTAGSNISAVTINNLFAETITGKLIDDYEANIMDLIINNIEFENIKCKDTYVLYEVNEAQTYIKNNIRNTEICYLINIEGNVKIESIIGTFYDLVFSYNNTTYIKGLILAKGYGKSCIINSITSLRSSYADIILGTNDSIFLIDNISLGDYTENCIYTKLTQLPEFSGTWWNNISAEHQGYINITETTSIINPDLIKEYGAGTIFDSKKHLNEVSSVVFNSNRYVPCKGISNNQELSFIKFNYWELPRKFKFNNCTKLIFNHIGANQWAATHFVAEYYSNGEIVQSDNINLPASTIPTTTEYNLYSGTYDYMKLTAQAFMGIINCIAV